MAINLNEIKMKFEGKCWFKFDNNKKYHLQIERKKGLQGNNFLMFNIFLYKLLQENELSYIWYFYNYSSFNIDQLIFEYSSD